MLVDMFWTWRNLKRVYAALGVIAVVALCAGWLAQKLHAPDWVWSAICVAAVVTWIVVGVIAVMKQSAENGGDEGR